ncbi:cytochrome c [Mucilaginibacter gracilis]|uniref:Cytochrome c n=1 Tax=Mucilaginibacter gracilis TaxID=423350 RepID=A0A495J6A7_9SPHI|nr:cytochrome c [Mucilaginibacter gracilis]RKR84152.1 cytochrome c [Mucilaginibacter gracilis]
MTLLQIHTPVPKDIPLPLPLPEWALVVLLVLSFLLHIIFISLMVGGSIVTLWAEIKGLKEKRFDTFANEIAKTITVNKSIAVVLGIAPLLSIGTLYTMYFYAANALTGFAWIMIIPLVTIAFLLTYLHKYTWYTFKDSKRIHIAIMALSVGIFLFIPLIFLVNVNLMMFPEKWGTIHGFLSALLLPNVIPRYLEFLGSCIAITGIFIVWYNGRKNYPVEEIYEGDFSRTALKKTGYSIALLGLALQIFFGVIVLFSLPSKGISYDVIAVMAGAGMLLAAALYYTYLSLTGAPEKIDLYFRRIAGLMLVYMLFYGSSRQMYRNHALSKHQALMAARTAEFEKLSKEAAEHPVAEQPQLELDPALGNVARGAALFQANCAGCHRRDEKLVGPPMTEMVSIYKGNNKGLEAWIRKPGKKRPDFPQMPTLTQLTDADREELAKYILSIK